MNITTQETMFRRTHNWILRENKKWLNRPKSDKRQDALHELSCRAKNWIRDYAAFEKWAYLKK